MHGVPIVMVLHVEGVADGFEDVGFGLPTLCLALSFAVELPSISLLQILLERC